MAPAGRFPLASTAMLYNSRGRESGARLSGEADHRQNPWQPRAVRPGGCLNSSAARLACFPRAKPGCPVLAAKGGIKNGAHEGAHLASAAILHTSRGRSPQTACKAKPITGRTLGAQGRKARRRHQPSRRSRVNLREYRQAPPRSRSRPPIGVSPQLPDFKPPRWDVSFSM